MPVAAPKSSGDTWEQLPGWTPVYHGLGRFRTGLMFRLVLGVLTPLALALAFAEPPIWFLKSAFGLAPLCAVVTTLFMLRGLNDYTRPPPETKAAPSARTARAVFLGLLLVDVVHVCLAAAFVFGIGGVTPDALMTVQVLAWLVGLGAIGSFVLSIRRIAEFVGATPELAKLSHIWRALIILIPALILARAVNGPIAELGPGVAILVGLMLVGAAVYVMAGVVQVVTDQRDNLLLTTSEFAAVSVTGEVRAVSSAAKPVAS